jgi:hypothetical protein
MNIKVALVNHSNHISSQKFLYSSNKVALLAREETKIKVIL